MNNTDPTGLWGKERHKNFTNRAIDSLLGIKEITVKQLKIARRNLSNGSIYPDQVLKGVRKWHGHEDWEKVKERQFRRAKRHWKKKEYAKAYLEIGKALHTIQDFYAHNVVLGGMYIDARHPFGNKKLKVDENGNFDLGMAAGYIDTAFLNACIQKYELKEGDKIHKFTADNLNADFRLVNEDYKWVWINNKKANPRYQNLMAETVAYLRNFVIWTGHRKG